MKERPLTTQEIFDLTTRLIGHCDDSDQLRYIVRYTRSRLSALSKRRRLEEISKQGG